MKSGWESAWDIIKKILLFVSLAFVIYLIISLFTEKDLIKGLENKKLNDKGDKK